MGEEPWISREDFCPPNKAQPLAGDPCAHVGPASSNQEILDCLGVTMKDRIQGYSAVDTYRKPSKDALRQMYEGRFTHNAYGDLTLFLNETSQEMNMAFGPVGRWELEFVSQSVAIARGYDVHWYYTHTLTFDIEDDVATQFEVNFEPEAHPVFVRDD